VATRIAEIVADGITDKTQVHTLLHHYVMHELCSKAPPGPNDCAYFPIDNDLKNHIYMAKRTFQLSCLDQENAHLKIQQWKKTHPDDTHFFRPYIQKEASEPSEDDPPAATPVCNERKKFVGNDGIDDTAAITDSGWYT